MSGSAAAPGSLAPSVDALLRAHGIAGEPRAIEHDGFSGAGMFAIEHGGERFLLKHLRFDSDWLMRATGDSHGREAQFAASTLVARLPASIRTPMLGACVDGDGWALLMRDITPSLLPRDGVVGPETMQRVIDAIAGLHAGFWGESLVDDSVAFCTPAQRLNVLSPASGQMLVDAGRDFGLLRGWRLFDRIAPPGAAALVRALFADPSPLVRLCDSLPRTLLHGDLKCANLGVDAGAVWMFDWSFVSNTAAAVDLAWFLGVNSSRLPWTLDETLDRYAASLEATLGAARFGDARWPQQRAAAMLVGLMMYGWGKALDAEAGSADELHWWCERALEARPLLA